MSPKRKPTPAENELLGWRAAYGKDAQVVLEGPIDGYPDWRIALTYFGVDGRVVLGEVRVIPAGDRLAWIETHHDVPAATPIQLNVGQWSQEPRVLKGKIGIPARLLKSIRIGDLNSQVVPMLKENETLAVANYGGNSRTLAQVWSSVLADERAKPRSAGRSDEFYAIWAARVVEMIGRKHANKELAEMYKDEDPDLDAKKVAHYTRVARDRCLYISNGQGVAGGRLTAKAENLLAGLTKGKAKS